MKSFGVETESLRFKRRGSGGWGRERSSEGPEAGSSASRPHRRAFRKGASQFRQ